MDIIEAIKTRKSIRGYKPTPVPKEVLRELLEMANRAPSTMNTRPWEFTVISGEVIKKIIQANIEKFDAGVPPQNDVIRGPFEGKFKDRQAGIGIQLFKLMGIGREDKEKRNDWMKRGLCFFDAPAAIIISADSSLGEAAQFDIGIIAQTIALTALKYGLGTCIEGQGVRYPDIVRKFTGIPESSRLHICLAIGYPDWEFPANKVQSEREGIDSITKWCGL